MIRIATMEIASTKTSMIAMPTKIFEAAEGLRPKALITGVTQNSDDDGRFHHCNRKHELSK